MSPLSSPSRLRRPALLAAGLLAIAAATGAALWWLAAAHRTVLFEHLPDTQLNSIAAELDRAGIPYTIDRGQAAVSVGDADARAARLAVMASGGTLHDAVGFELFDKSDFGMTDFAQKINYQRALEGEIARTIGALTDIKYTRVHLVLPEHSLFNRDEQHPRASVTVFLEHGDTMPADQVQGIQRITASAVPDLDEQDVTVVNQNGETLSAPALVDGRPVTLPARLAQKRAMEDYIAGKIRQVLRPALGSDRFAVSVAINLDLNQITTTREKVLDAGANTGVRHLRETSNHNKGDSGSADQQREVDYAVGHESQRVVRSGGEISRLQVGVVIDDSVRDVDAGKLRDLIAAAAGADSARGDHIAVVRSHLPAARAMPAPTPGAAVPAPAPHRTAPAAAALPDDWNLAWLFAAGLACGIGGALGMRRLQLPQRRSARRLRRELQHWIHAEVIEAEQL